MISLITCSVNIKNYQRFEKSVKETIGVEYEIIKINNSLNEYSICEAYNLGGSKAKFNYLVFVHEDVEFVTTDWGCQLIKHLKDKNIGLIGLAGAAYKTSLPYSWSIPEFSASHIIEIDQKNNGQEKYRKINQLFTDPAEVVVIDGVFLATRMDVFSLYKFDEKMLKGFHGYDIDYSFSISRKFKAFVVFDILLKHYSSGNQNKEWLNSAISICKKWKYHLPFSLHPLKKDEIRRINYRCSMIFIWKVKEVGFPLLHRLNIILFSLPYKDLGFLNTFKLLKQIR